MKENCEFENVMNDSVLFNDDVLNRQWRYSQMAISFLVMLIRHDHPLPTVAIELLTRNLVHDALAVRKVH